MKTIDAEVKPQTKEEKRQALRKQLDELTRDALDLDASYYLEEEDLDDGDLDAIMDKLQDAVNENAEILYYSRAIEFLSENDASLNRSLELAKDYGYSIEDLNSEKLASLLNYDILMGELGNIRDEVEEILDARQEIDED